MTEIAQWLERFRRGPELLAAVMTGAAGTELLDFVPGPGKWSIRQIVCHLSDAELVGAVRLRTVLAEDNPVLMAFDQEAWARNLGYGRRKMTPVLETFRRIRAENYELLKELPGEAFERKAAHSELGTITLGELLQGYAEHAESHARQVQQLRQTFKESKARV
jgi:hypothetical protein